MTVDLAFASLSRRSLTAALLVALAPLGCLATSGEGSESVDEGDNAITSDALYTLQGVQSGKCVGVSSGSTTNGANVDQATCDGSTKQQWKMRSLGGGLYQLVAQHSGKCMDIAYASLENGANVQQYACSDTLGNQKWKAVAVATGEYQLIVQQSGKCLDVQDFSKVDGGNLQQWGCGTGDNQRFRLNQVGASGGGSGGGTTGSNPLAGSTFYVDPNTQAAAAEAKTRASGDTADADLIKKISTHAQGIWFGEWSGDPKTAVSQVVAKAAGKVPILVAYNMYKRDCGAYSSGGASSPDAYKAWIDGFAAGIGNAKVAVVLEPDALSIWTDTSKRCFDGTPGLVSYAVSALKRQPNAHVYIDSGTSRWNSAANMANTLKQSGITVADGFALNTSYTASTPETATFGHSLSDALGGKVPFVIDTSRNAKGAPTDSEWCNARGRGLGTPATANTGDARIHALFWVKNPGESDGECGKGDPAAGQWFQYIALDLARNASF